MIIIAVLKDEQVDGQRKAAGRQIRQRVVLALDKFNVVLATGAGDNPLAGKKFFANLSQMSRRVSDEFGIDNDYCLLQTNVAFRTLSQQLGGEMAEGMTGDFSWAKLDEMFQVSARELDSSLTLYSTFKSFSWEESGDE